MTTRVEELDKSGRPQSVIETVERVTRKNGRQQSELVRALRNGRDVTDEERRRRAERKAEDASEGEKESGGRRQKISASAMNPFARSDQGKYRFSLSGPDPAAPWRVRIQIASGFLNLTPFKPPNRLP